MLNVVSLLIPPLISYITLQKLVVMFKLILKKKKKSNFFGENEFHVSFRTLLADVILVNQDYLPYYNKKKLNFLSS